MHAVKLILGVVLMGLAVSGANSPPVEYLSESPHLIVYSKQGWGELGFDVCAHQAGSPPLELQIKDKKYEKGLGHHAPGEIVVDLDGGYDLFEAEVGVQWQNDNVGSVVFQVFVDDEKRLDSGLMTEGDPPREISVPTEGASELRLVVTDGGNGMTCDCANWANARLTPSKSPAPKTSPNERVDISAFAQVVTSDPNRLDGVRADRVEEFPEEDVFLETELTPNSGVYSIPSEDGKIGCIGLKWVERRLLTEIGLHFADPDDMPPAEDAQVQGWFGVTTHQGEWKPLNGRIEVGDGSWIFPISIKENPEARHGMRKVRWIVPISHEPIRLRGLPAFTRSKWKTVGLKAELEKFSPGRQAHIEVYNGEIEGGSRDWDLGGPLSFQVRYSDDRYQRFDRTVLRFSLPGDAFGVAVDDVLTNGCVYVRDVGLFIKPADSELTPAEYKHQIDGKKTVLDRVREMPDQTFEQAMAKTRNPVQDNGPTMLSLACDNSKWVMEQDGTVRFALVPQKPDRNSPSPTSFPCAMVPKFGGGKVGRGDRHLEGGWLPIVVSSWWQDGVIYRQRCFVAPFDKTDSRLWLNSKPLGVAEFTIENSSDIPSKASLALTFLEDAGNNTQARVHTSSDGAVVLVGDQLAAYLEIVGLEANIEEGRVHLEGNLPANGEAKCVVYLPGWPMKPENHKELARGDLALDVKAYWQSVMADTMRFEIPDDLLAKAIRASQVHCLIASRNEEEGERVAAWAAADRYGALESESNSIILGMGLMGHGEFARRAHDFFIARYSPAGFLTTGYTLLGTGWQLQALGKHYGLTRDKEWLKRHSSEIARVCEFILDQRRKTMKLDARGQRVPEYGLIPPGVMADWDNFLPYFCLSGYYCAGLHEAATALKDIGHPEANRFLQEAAEFRADILDAYHRAQSRTPIVPLQDGTWVKAYPSEAYHAGPLGDFFPGEDGDRSWCYDVELGAHQMVPQSVMDARGSDAGDMMDHMEDVQFLADGWFDYPAERNHEDWFNLGGFSKVQPYYTRNAEIYAMRDDVKPFIRSYFNTLATLLNTENLSLWEHFHNTAAWNKTHETGYFLQQSRFMLLMEQGDRLWLAPFVTRNWLKDGMVVAVENAPTRFGNVSYRIASRVSEGLIEASIEPPDRQSPEEIVLRLRHPEGKAIRSVTVNGKPHARFAPDEETVTLPGNSGEAPRLVVRY